MVMDLTDPRSIFPRSVRFVGFKRDERDALYAEVAVETTGEVCRCSMNRQDLKLGFQQSRWWYVSLYCDDLNEVVCVQNNDFLRFRAELRKAVRPTDLYV